MSNCFSVVKKFNSFVFEPNPIAMSDESYFPQFQFLIQTKFDGGVEELLFLLKSGGGDEVVVKQLADYLMVW